MTQRTGEVTQAAVCHELQDLRGEVDTVPRLQVDCEKVLAHRHRLLQEVSEVDQCVEQLRAVILVLRTAHDELCM